MKQCAEDMELKLQGNKQSVVFSGIKNIVKTSSGNSPTHRLSPENVIWINVCEKEWNLGKIVSVNIKICVIYDWICCIAQAQQRAAGAGAIQTGRQMYRGTSARSAASPCGSADGLAGVPTSMWRYSCDHWSRSVSGSGRPPWLCSTWTSAGPFRSSTREPLLRKVSECRRDGLEEGMSWSQVLIEGIFSDQSQCCTCNAGKYIY